MIRISNIKIAVDESESIIENIILKTLNVKKINSYKIHKKAIDARKKHDIKYVYSVDVSIDNELDVLKRADSKNTMLVKDEKYTFPIRCTSMVKRPVIVGFGPAGMFCAFTLAQNGYAPIIVERGKCVEERQNDVESFWHGGSLNENSNVQFGEGGAGTFSDGKLTTGIKDIRIKKVLEEFVRFGASEEILYLAKPHIGTDKLRTVVKMMREEIIRLGGEVRFNSLLSDIIIENGKVVGGVISRLNGGDYVIDTDNIVLATGHSARDTFAMLKKRGIKLEQKPFSIGARIEHTQEMIGKSQYGDMYKSLSAADYKLSVHLESGRSVYTFCQCPGGYVINSSSERDRLVTNGMSNFARDGVNANSALLVGVKTSDFPSSDPLAGIELQRQIEHKAFILGGSNYNAPVQTVGDFLNNTPSVKLGKIQNTFLPSVSPCNIGDIFPEFITSSMREGILLMDKQLKGFADHDAVLTAPETRSSSPVRIVRDKMTYETNICGLLTAGEGGGHAGGITSAAVDGIHAAECIAKNINRE